MQQHGAAAAQEQAAGRVSERRWDTDLPSYLICTPFTMLHLAQSCLEEVL